jgi:O-acetyl-ADP-ribose deacetylase (regulator of RNase III)
MIHFTSGDLFAAPGLVGLAHGCNCAGAMGKGIALEFRRRWPAMYEEYRKRCAAGSFSLGDVFAWKADDGVTVFNLGTQRTWRTQAELPAIEAAVGRMLELAAERTVRRIGLPRIGAGLGGLPWPEVKALLQRVAASSTVELVVLEEFADLSS